MIELFGQPTKEPRESESFLGFQTSLKQKLREIHEEYLEIQQRDEYFYEFGKQIEILTNLQQNKEILKLIPNWEKIDETIIYKILNLNLFLDDLSLDRQICPYCFTSDIIEDHTNNEKICTKCSLVIQSHIIPPQEKFALLLLYLQNFEKKYGESL